jgi:hypothetical protein
MIPEKWVPVFGKDHAPAKTDGNPSMGFAAAQLNPSYSSITTLPTAVPDSTS